MHVLDGSGLHKNTSFEIILKGIMFYVVCWQSSFFLRNTVELFAQVRAFANASCYERKGIGPHHHLFL